MPTYEFSCKAPGCGKDYEVTCSIDTYEEKYYRSPLCECGAKLFRVFSFTTKPGFDGHYNHSIGDYVETRSQLNSKLAQLSDQTSERMGGMPCKFEAISPMDVEHTVRKTDRGLQALDDTNRHQRSIGRTQSKFYADGTRPSRVKRSTRFKPYTEVEG